MTHTHRSRIVLAHGGAEGDLRHVDGPERAARAGLALLAEGRAPLDAVVEAVRLLEDDARFNAGRGSNLRLDGHTIHMDAALADSGGRFAAVIGLDSVRNPIIVARDLLRTPHAALAGAGATRFAREMGHAPFDPRTEEARAKLADVARARSASADTVGAVAFDGETFAAAGSTGGLIAVLDGRVSDIALPGCGIDASAAGAVCVSGAGDAIVRARVASRVLRLLEEGARADAAAEQSLAWIPQELGLAVLAVSKRGDAAGRGRAPFPWAIAREDD